MVAEIVATPRSKVNDFAVKLANVNGTGSASANSLLMQAIFRMGIPVSGKNLFPSNIQGLPTWYEIRVNKDGHTARALRVRPHGGDERADLRARHRGGREPAATCCTTRPGRSTRRCIREDVTFLGVPLAEMCNEKFHGPRERILMKNIAYAGALVALLDIDMDVIDAAARREVRRQGGAARVEPARRCGSGYDYAMEHFDCPLPFRLETMDATRGLDPDRRQHRDRARLRLRGRHRRRLVSDHAVDVGDGRVHQVLREVPQRPGDRARTTTSSCRPRTSWPRSAWCSARRGTARARSRRRPDPASR